MFAQQAKKSKNRLFNAKNEITANKNIGNALKTEEEKKKCIKKLPKKQHRNTLANVLQIPWKWGGYDV